MVARSNLVRREPADAANLNMKICDGRIWSSGAAAGVVVNEKGVRELPSDMLSVPGDPGSFTCQRWECDTRDAADVLLGTLRLLAEDDHAMGIAALRQTADKKFLVLQVWRSKTAALKAKLAKENPSTLDQIVKKVLALEQSGCELVMTVQTPTNKRARN